MEIHVGTQAQVTTAVPDVSGNVTFVVYRNNEPLGPQRNATVADSVATGTLPYRAVHSEGNLRVEFRFNVDGQAYTKNVFVDVVTPYLSLAEVKAMVPEATDTEARELEAAMRHIIDSHTGQSFGFAENLTIHIEGHGESALRLPRRLLELRGLSTLTAELDVKSGIVVSDGWYLKKGWSAEVTPRISDSLYWTGWEPDRSTAPGEPGFEKATHGHVIAAPGTSGTPTEWKQDYPFDIRGDWGYYSVPEPVRQAAKLLLNDYACSETLYRDRYLDSIKSADWQFAFNSRTWSATGNARADKLLSDYILWDWAVI